MKLPILLGSSLLLLTSSAYAINASDRYRSPRNPERKVRASTELIVLHTTEAPAKSSLTKVSDRGECHFVVTEEGSVYTIVDRDREAFHAGRSMWNGREDVDKFSVGIECVGYHDKAMPTVQIDAIAKLVKELQAMYNIPDARVVAHSHVAYGAPNKWHKNKHRGRKRCGMLFAMASVRRRLGLKARPAYDADVRAHRLVQADQGLAKVLYGNVDTMRSAYPSEPPKRDAAEVLRLLTRQAKTEGATAVSAKPKATDAKGAAVSAKPKANAARASSSFKTPPRSVAELKSRGYRQVGNVTKGVTARKLAGSKWNSADTYYTIRNKVIPGNVIDEAHIEKGMGVWLKK